MTSPLFAYSMSPRDVDAGYFEDAPDEIFCPECDSVLDSSYMPSALVVHKGGAFSVGFTYDGQPLCSTVMKELMKREGLAVDFWEVNARLGLHRFEPREQLVFDAGRRNTRFMGACSRCGGFKDVIGTNPMYLRQVSAPILTGLYRTDLKFGSGRRKGVELIVGIQTKEVLATAKPRGCRYVPITQEQCSPT